MNVDYSKTSAIGGGAMCGMGDGPTDGLVDWYCKNSDCGNMWTMPAGEKPGPCSACGGEMEEDGKPCLDGEHQWTGQQVGGPPDMAESTEWVEFCKVCGMERHED